MQVTVEESGGLERRLHIQVPAEKVDGEVESRLKSYGRRAKIKGFRPGKVPFKVIKKRFGGEIRQQVVSELMQSSFSEAVTQEKLLPAGGPRIEPGNLEEGEDLSYTAVFEVYPEIEPAGLDKIKVERPVAEVGEKDIDRVIENLRTQKATWEPVARAAKTGDRVNVDFDGRRDGEAVEGASGEKVPVEIGSGAMLADFEQGLEGVKAGEEREFDVRFPDDYQPAELGGTTLHFTIKAHEVQEQRKPEVDEEFCQSFGVLEGGIESLRADVRANMEREMQQNIRAEMKTQVLDGLLKHNELQLPAALVAEEVGRLQQDAARRLNISDPARLPPGHAFEEQARRRVALGLMINEIVTREKIELDANRVDEKLAEVTADYEDPAQVIRAYRANPQMMQGIEAVVMEDLVIDWLLERAKVKDRKTTFSKLMKLDQK